MPEKRRKRNVHRCIFSLKRRKNTWLVQLAFPKVITGVNNFVLKWKVLFWENCMKLRLNDGFKYGHRPINDFFKNSFLMKILCWIDLPFKLNVLRWAFWSVLDSIYADSSYFGPQYALCYRTRLCGWRNKLIQICIRLNRIWQVEWWNAAHDVHAHQPAEIPLIIIE